MSAPSARPPSAIGLYLAVVQFFLALSWVVYVAYLPQLAQRAGIEPRWVPWLLMTDQLVFLVCDLAVGLASDRAARVLGRIGRAVVAATLLSTGAFVLLPWAAPQGSPGLFVALTLVWAVTSSALRAPPMALLGRYVAQPSQPLMIALSSFGLGIANAVAPYVGLQLKAIDPAWPFMLSALGLAAVTLGIVAAERSLAGQAAPAAAPRSAEAPWRAAPALAFIVACGLAALAFQWHSAIASAPLVLRHAAAADLPRLLPVFWVGFNLALVPAGWYAQRAGPLPAMFVGAIVAMSGSAAASFAPTLAGLLAAQCLAGSGWALLLCSAFGAALKLGAGGREGLMSGALSSTLALATLLRIGFVTGASPKPPTAAELAWLAALGFAVCALLLRGQRRQ